MKMTGLDNQPDSSHLVVFSDPSARVKWQVASVVEKKAHSLVVHLYNTYTDIFRFPNKLKKAIFRPAWLDTSDGRFIYLKRGFMKHQPLTKTVKNPTILVSSFPLNADETLPEHVIKRLSNSFSPLAKTKRRNKAPSTASKKSKVEEIEEEAEEEDEGDEGDEGDDEFCHQCEACSEKKIKEADHTEEDVESLTPVKLRKGDRGIVQSGDHFLKVRILDTEEARYFVHYENVPNGVDAWISIESVCARIPPRTWQLKRIGADGRSVYPFQVCTQFNEGKSYLGTATKWGVRARQHHVVYDDQSTELMSLPDKEVDIMNDGVKALSKAVISNLVKSRSDVRTECVSEAFGVGEHVLAFWGPRLYTAKILDINEHKTVVRDKGVKKTPLYVHFMGWSENHDSWLEQNHVCKLTPDNLLYQQELEVVFQSQAAARRKDGVIKRAAELAPTDLVANNASREAKKELTLAAAALAMDAHSSNRYFVCPVTSHLNAVACSFGWTFKELPSYSSQTLSHLSNLCRRGKTEFNNEYIQTTVAAGRTFVLCDKNQVILSFCCISKWRYSEQKVYADEDDQKGTPNWHGWKDDDIMWWEQNRTFSLADRNRMDEKRDSGMVSIDLVGGCEKHKPAAALVFAMSLDMAQKFGYDSAILDLQPTVSFEVAVAFYHKHGFQEVQALNSDGTQYTQGYLGSGGKGNYRPNFFYYRSGTPHYPLITAATARARLRLRSKSQKHVMFTVGGELMFAMVLPPEARYKRRRLVIKLGGQTVLRTHMQEEGTLVVEEKHSRMAPVTPKVPKAITQGKVAEPSTASRICPMCQRTLSSNYFSSSQWKLNPEQSLCQACLHSQTQAPKTPQISPKPMSSQCASSSRQFVSTLNLFDLPDGRKKQFRTPAANTQKHLSSSSSSKRSFTASCLTPSGRTPQSRKRPAALGAYDLSTSARKPSTPSSSERKHTLLTPSAILQSRAITPSPKTSFASHKRAILSPSPTDSSKRARGRPRKFGDSPDSSPTPAPKTPKTLLDVPSHNSKAPSLTKPKKFEASSLARSSPLVVEPPFDRKARSEAVASLFNLPGLPDAPKRKSPGLLVLKKPKKGKV